VLGVDPAPTFEATWAVTSPAGLQDAQNAAAARALLALTDDEATWQQLGPPFQELWLQWWEEGHEDQAGG
jgi:hypothetical protein